MLKIRNLPIWISLFIILVIVSLGFACSRISAANPTVPSDLSYLVDSDPAKVDNTDLPITPIEKLHVTGISPQVDVSQYRLTVTGLVNNPLSLTYETILSYPSVTATVLLICPGSFADNAEWTGVSVTTLLAEAGINPQATQITFYALDKYQRTLSLKEVQGEVVFLAYTVDNQILPIEHGYPLRLVVKGEYGSNWVKWVEGIVVT